MNKAPKFFYYILTIVCLIAIATFFILDEIPFIIPYFIYIVWLLVERFISIRDERKSTGEKDKGTVLVYASSRVCNLISGLISVVFLNITLNLNMLVLGSFLIALGAVLRYKAIITLGRFYSHLIDIKTDHRIIKHGVYAYIRHPAYTGMLISTLGLTLACLSWLSALTFFVGVLPSIILRIKIEEVSLASIPGYEDYKKSVKKLIPFIY